jgi:hypothetical protein
MRGTAPKPSAGDKTQQSSIESVHVSKSGGVDVFIFACRKTYQV